MRYGTNYERRTDRFSLDDLKDTIQKYRIGKFSNSFNANTRYRKRNLEFRELHEPTPYFYIYRAYKFEHGGIKVG